MKYSLAIPFTLASLVALQVDAATFEVETCDDLELAVAATATEDTTANFTSQTRIDLNCGLETDGDYEEVRTFKIENNELTIEAPFLSSFRAIELSNVRFEVVSSGELLVTHDASFDMTTELEVVSVPLARSGRGGP